MAGIVHRITPHHEQILAKAGIPRQAALDWGIWTSATPSGLEGTDIDSPRNRELTGLVFPLRRLDGSITYQMRVDDHLVDEAKGVRKYAQASGVGSVINVPAIMADRVGKAATVLVVEGTKQTIAASLYAPEDTLVIGVQGIMNWSKDGAPVPALAEAVRGAQTAIVVPDADFTKNLDVYTAAERLRDVLDGFGLEVKVARVPSASAKAGLDDFLGADPDTAARPRMLARILEKARFEMGRRPAARKATRAEKADEAAAIPAAKPKHRRPVDRPITLEECVAVHRKWLGESYDAEAGLAVWATAASHAFPVTEATWLLVVAGSGGAKTESVMPLVEVGATVASTIASEGALLSATSQKERATDASGGLLRQIGDEGILVIKDVTTILSMSGDARASVLAALREVYDGQWTRFVGADGGREITWTGKVTCLGACTTAWDQAHAVISSMGDRFLLVRIDTSSPKARRDAARSARKAYGKEAQMRDELGKAVAELLAGATPLEELEMGDEAGDALLDAADLVARARTAAIRDARGEVEGAHAPEMATRILKQATGVFLGALALGAVEQTALDVALRCLRDSLPPNRAKILADLAENPATTTYLVAQRTQVPRTTIDRELQALAALGVLVKEVETTKSGRERWTWSLAEDVDPRVLAPRSVEPVKAPEAEAPKPPAAPVAPKAAAARPAVAPEPEPADDDEEEVEVVEVPAARVPTARVGGCDGCGVDHDWTECTEF